MLRQVAVINTLYAIAGLQHQTFLAVGGEFDGAIASESAALLVLLRAAGPQLSYLLGASKLGRWPPAGHLFS